MNIFSTSLTQRLLLLLYNEHCPDVLAKQQRRDRILFFTLTYFTLLTLLTSLSLYLIQQPRLFQDSIRRSDRQTDRPKME